MPTVSRSLAFEGFCYRWGLQSKHTERQGGRGKRGARCADRRHAAPAAAHAAWALFSTTPSNCRQCECGLGEAKKSDAHASERNERKCANDVINGTKNRAPREMPDNPPARPRAAGPPWSGTTSLRPPWSHGAARPPAHIKTKREREREGGREGRGGSAGGRRKRPSA